MHLVFADANVLYSRTLRDWTFLLSEESGMYSVISSREAVVEAMSSLRNTFPEFSGDQISVIQDHIEGALGDLITSFPGGAVEGIADPGDFHIYNAAAYAGAHILLTQNVKDFAAVQDPPFDLYSMDEFLMLAAENNPDAVMRTADRQRRYWQERFTRAGKPPKGLAQALIDAGATEFAAHVDLVLQKLAGVGLPTSADPLSLTPAAADQPAVR